MTLNSDGKLELTLTLWFQNWHKELGELFIKAHKSLKICTLMGSFCLKRNVSARKFQRNYVS